MSFQPTPTQALLLFELALNDGTALLEALSKPKPADRRPLVAAKIVAESKVSRKIRIRLADAGWAWVNGNLTAELPASQKPLALLLAKLDAHFGKTNQTFADIIGPLESEPEAPPPKPEKKARPKTAVGGEKVPSGKPAKPSRKTPAIDLRDRIEKAYLAVTRGGRDQMAPLAQVRAHLSDLDRKSVDGALAQILKSDPKASLMRNDDPSRLSPADREAEFNPYGEPFHYLWIAS